MTTKSISKTTQTIQDEQEAFEQHMKEQLSPEQWDELNQEGSEYFERLKDIYHKIQDYHKRIEALKDKLPTLEGMDLNNPPDYGSRLINMDKMPKELIEFEESIVELEAELQLRLMLFRAKTDEEIAFKDMIMLKLLKESKGQVDKYGIPAKLIGQTGEEIDNEVREQLKKEFDKIVVDEDLYNHIEKEGYTRDQLDDFMDRALENGIPFVRRMLLKEVGKMFQNPFRSIEALLKKGIVRSDKFKKKGISKTTDRNEQIRKEFNAMQSKDEFKVKAIIELLSKKYKLSIYSIRDIVYK